MSAAQPSVAEPKSRPIAFSDAMVRAILAGTKWQTRRVISPQPPPYLHGRTFAPVVDNLWGAWAVEGTTRAVRDEDTLRCHYGAVGDYLWVREGLRRDDVLVRYSADGEHVRINGELAAWSWKPSALSARYCPRLASRIDLEVVEVRVQRVADISEEDARAEGVKPAPFCKAGRPNGMEHVESFELLWDSINAKRPGCAWAENPFVWCVSFRRVRP